MISSLKIFWRQLRLFYLTSLGYLGRVFYYLGNNLKGVGIVAAALLLVVVLQVRFDIFGLQADVVSEGVVGTYQEHDIPMEVTRLVSRGLVKFDEKNQAVPDLAEKWAVNSDSTVFTFKLKDNLIWSDGTPVKSSDMDFGISEAQESFPDDKTIQFKLHEPFSPLPSLLTRPVFKKGTLTGVGPYKITSVKKSQIFITKLTLVPLKKDLPLVSVRFYPSEEVAVTGFKLGEVQSVLGVDEATLKELDNNSLVGYKQQTDYTKLVSILYNNKDAVLSNRSLRQALSFSAPEISGKDLADGPISPKSWAYEGNLKNYLNNEDEAKQALGRAKSSGSEDLLSKEITLTSTVQLQDIGAEVVKAWKDLGINAVLRVESGVPQSFQALLITRSIPKDPDQYALWHSTQTKTNLTQYESKRVDKDLEDGRKISDTEKRKDSYFDFQKALLEDSPATFLYFQKYNVVYLKKAQGKLDEILSLQLPFWK